ncbi:MAG: hypothetical protein AAFX53_14285 [Bacteroidota bacterium]
MKDKLYPIRFQLFLFSQLAILFGALIFPRALFANVLDPILFLMNLLVGMLLLSKRPKLQWVGGSLLVLNGIVFMMATVLKDYTRLFDFVRMGSYFLFYLMVSLEIMRQIWHTEQVNKNVTFERTKRPLF